MTQSLAISKRETWITTPRRVAVHVQRRCTGVKGREERCLLSATMATQGVARMLHKFDDGTMTISLPLRLRAQQK